MANRNAESHFGAIPSKNIRRSKFKRDCNYKTTFNTGDIVPIYVDEVLPGDTVKMNMATLVRMLTPISPTMDNAWVDIYWYFVPRRLTWEHWPQFMGENTEDEWTQTQEYTIPQLKAPENGWSKGSLGEKIYGVQGIDNISVDAQYMRSYVMIFNEWFRNQNVTEPAEMSKGDADTLGSNGTSYVTDLQKGGAMAKAVKYADYYTRALPSPQKGPDIYIPLSPTASLSESSAPVITGDITDAKKTDPAMLWLNKSAQLEQQAPYMYQAAPAEVISGDPDSPTVLAQGYVPNNLHTDLSDIKVNLTGANGATINQLRQAFAIQRMYELDARGGRANACASSLKKSRKKTGRLNRKAC